MFVFAPTNALFSRSRLPPTISFDALIPTFCLRQRLPAMYIQAPPPTLLASVWSQAFPLRVA
jgi:hypothetical protein